MVETPSPAGGGNGGESRLMVQKIIRTYTLGEYRDR